MRKMVLVAAGVLVLASGFGVARTEPTGFAEVKGRLEECSQVAAGVKFALRVDKDLRRFEISSKDIPLPSDHYRNVIPGGYEIFSGCPAKGSQLRVTSCSGCPPPILAVEYGGDTEAFQEERRALWIVQRFVDRAGGPSTTYANVFGVSMFLARYNRVDRGGRGFWLRDGLSRALDTYSFSDRAAAMIQRFGRPEFAKSVQALVRVYERHGGAIGLVHAIPYIPTDSRTAPFVGAWGHFVTKVYVEDAEGRLTKAY